jgi:taurine dioxygenase
MPTLVIQRIGHALGARVTGIDLSRPLSDGDFAALHAAWLEHQVLVIADQRLGPRELAAFSARFGELDDFSNQSVHHAAEDRHVMLLTNRPQDGKPSKTFNAGQNWHTDQSYSIRPSKGTFVHCLEKPSVGGDTMFANMYLAYEALSPTMRAFLDGLEAVHDASLIEGLDKRGPEVVAEFKRRNPPVIHPAVRVHPDTGRRALYVNERVRQFVGLTEAESRPLVQFLCQHSVSPRFIYRHYWSLGDLVFWDNRCLVHMAVGDYDPTEIRHMLRCSGLGDHYGRLRDAQAAAPATAPAAGSRQMESQIASLHD